MTAGVTERLLNLGGDGGTEDNWRGDRGHEDGFIVVVAVLLLGGGGGPACQTGRSCSPDGCDGWTACWHGHVNTPLYVSRLWGGGCVARNFFLGGGERLRFLVTDGSDGRPTPPTSRPSADRWRRCGDPCRGEGGLRQRCLSSSVGPVSGGSGSDGGHFCSVSVPLSPWRLLVTGLCGDFRTPTWWTSRTETEMLQLRFQLFSCFLPETRAGRRGLRARPCTSAQI